MVDNINIPSDITNIIKVEYKPEPLRRFLVDLLLRIDTLEKKVTELERNANGNT